MHQVRELSFKVDPRWHSLNIGHFYLIGIRLIEDGGNHWNISVEREHEEFHEFLVSNGELRDLMSHVWPNGSETSFTLVQGISENVEPGMQDAIRNAIVIWEQKLAECKQGVSVQ